MPDFITLTPPGGGTAIEIGTYAIADRVDFGTRGLLKAGFVEGPHTEGALAVEETVVRKMSFPLILGASRSMPALGLFDQEALLRKAARPGAVVDVLPQGATTAVRFDVLAGRFEFDYNIHHNREGVRIGTLELETKPYGYWPTMILLASVASVALPGAVTWAGSIIGDAPGLAKIVVQPTVASIYPSGSWPADFLALAISHRASHQSLLRPASFAFLAGASLLGEAFAPASQAVRYAASQNQADWLQMTRYVIASALEPAYRGRFRAFGWFKLSPSQALPWRTSLDAVPEHLASFAALGSYAAVATIVPQVASGVPGAFGPQPSPAYQLLDLGELTLPPVGSGLGGGQALRVWAAPGAADVGVASPVITFGGLFLQPLDSDFAGMLPRGLAVPSISAPSPGRLVLDSEAGQAIVSGYGLNLATAQPWANAWQHYRGPLPQVASGVRLDILHGTRKTNVSVSAPSYPQLVGSLGPIGYYRMEETAGPTVMDTMGSRPGSWSVVPSLGGAGKIDRGAGFANSHYGRIPSLIVAQATSWSIQAWLKRTNSGAVDTVLQQGAVPGSGSGLSIHFNSSGLLRFGFGAAADDTHTPDSYENETEPALWTFTWDYATRGRAIWRDTQLLASGVAPGTYVGSGLIFVGIRSDLANAFDGLIDELAFFRGTAIGSDVVAQVYAYGNPTSAAASAPAPPLVHNAPAFASVSVAYRPRFAFMKGL